MGEVKKAWQLNAMWDPRTEDIRKKNGEIWIKAAAYLIVYRTNVILVLIIEICKILTLEEAE